MNSFSIVYVIYVVSSLSFNNSNSDKFEIIIYHFLNGNL